MESNKVYSLFGATGVMEEIKSIGSLPIYSRVYAFGAGMIDNVYAVLDNDNNLVKMSTLFEGDYFSSPYHKVDKYTRPLSKKFGIGFYYDDIHPDFRYDVSEVNEAIKRADLFISDQETKNAKKEQEKLKYIASLPSKYHHLKPLLDCHDHKAIKDNLIADLKFNFPSVKFSVKKIAYSCYDVSWINGVTADDVRKITNRYESYETDYGGDYRDYAPSNFNNVFGGFKYVFENREFCQKIKSLFNNYEEYELNRQINSILSRTIIPSNFETVEIIDNELVFKGIN